MNTHTFFLFLLLIITTYIISVSSSNDYYIISIQRNKNDTNYDNADNTVQYKIDELVNDRMNDIYDIIIKNKETYILENNELDEKLDELNSTIINSRYNKKFLFINKNRPKTNFNQILKTNNNNNNYIPIESKLLSHICPILNYYAIRAYLSDDIIEEVRQLPNIIHCEKSVKLKRPKYKSSHFTKKRKRFFDSSNSYYDLKYIQKETNWTNVSVQNNANTHLSLISQFNYNSTLVNDYDDNYYYPSTAGKGIDIYIIDDGLYINHEDFDTYKGERTVSCDAIVQNGVAKTTDSNTRKKCAIDSTYPEHGIMVASVAGGFIHGVAKKANIHMIDTDFNDYDLTAALDYIKKYGKPNKSIINISRGSGTSIYNKAIQEKINELTDAGFIIFVASGNEGINSCFNKKSKKNDKYNINNINASYSGYDNVISVGGTLNDIFSSTNNYRSEKDSNDGYCIDIHAPYYVVAASIKNDNSSEIYTDSIHIHGTSFSSPMAAGVAALIMAEHPEIKFNYKLMKTTLINMSIKNVISGFRSNETPNRFLNNGKHVVYSPDKKYHGCGILAGNTKCTKGCCSKFGICINPANDGSHYCKIENGCQSDFGQCSESNQKKKKKLK
eukprot:jgi/Orpsp1_1/1185639/evm.model.c7180000094689.1